MKTISFALAGALLVAVAPFALAAEQTCNETAATDYIEHPMQKGSYLFIDATEPNKIGQWSEKNAKPGLQTEKCYRAGILRYNPDVKLAILP